MDVRGSGFTVSVCSGCIGSTSIRRQGLQKPARIAVNQGKPGRPMPAERFLMVCERPGYPNEG